MRSGTGGIGLKILQDIDVVILCGGLGKRIRELTGDLPKPMVWIDRQPFLEIVLNYLKSYGFRRFIFCTGYHGQKIQEYFKDKMGCITLFSQEPEPLGTAGALKYCESHLESETILVLNGDSFCPLDYSNFLSFHVDIKRAVSIAVIGSKGRKDGGSILIDEEKRILSFDEKEESAGPYMNAGIYLMERKVLSEIPDKKPCSLEYEFFPDLLSQGVYAYFTPAQVYDIGTPERLDFFRRHYQTIKS